MTIKAQHITKRFGDFTALDDVGVEVADGSLTALLGPSGAASRPCCDHRRAREPDAGPVPSTAATYRPPPQERGVGFVFQHYAAFRHMTVRETSLSAWRSASARGRKSASASTNCSSLVQLDGLRRALSGAALRRPAAAHGPRARAGGRAAGAAARRAVRRPRRPRPQRAPRLATAPARRASRHHRARHPRPGGGDGRGRPIVVMDHGRVEQVGSPGEIYEQPGQRVRDELRRPGDQLDGALVRPHDLEILREPVGEPGP